MFQSQHTREGEEFEGYWRERKEREKRKRNSKMRDILTITILVYSHTRLEHSSSSSLSSISAISILQGVLGDTNNLVWESMYRRQHASCPEKEFVHWSTSVSHQHNLVYVDELLFHSMHGRAYWILSKKKRKKDSTSFPLHHWQRMLRLGSFYQIFYVLVLRILYTRMFRWLNPLIFSRTLSLSLS